MVKPRNVEDYRRLAAKRLPRMVFDYLDGGAESERGLRRNLAAFETICFEPWRLLDVSQRDLSIELFGRRQPMPLVIAPTGLNGALWPDGDVLLARAAARAGIPFALSTASNATIEDVANRAGGELWFQLYVVQRALAEALTKRALAAGYKTLVLTVDVPVNGKRERDMRNGFAIPFRYSPRAVLDGALHPDWLLRQLRHGLPELANFAGAGSHDVNAQAALMNRQMDASFAWDDLKALRDAWPHTLLVKGLLRAEDAEHCIQLGVDGVVISNHGARQLEDVAAPIEKLTEFAATDRPPHSDRQWVSARRRRGQGLGARRTCGNARSCDALRARRARRRGSCRRAPHPAPGDRHHARADRMRAGCRPQPSIHPEWGCKTANVRTRGTGVRSKADGLHEPDRLTAPALNRRLSSWRIDHAISQAHHSRPSGKGR